MEGPTSSLITALPEKRFQLMECLGQGSFGRVYRALDATTAQPAAVKIIDMSMDEVDVEGVEREIATMLRCSQCPECVTIYGAFHRAASSEIWIAMELCEMSVLDLIRVLQNGLPESVMRAVTRDVVRGLSFLHQQRLIHRDLKCGNVLLNARDGRARLCDFGVAAALGGAASKNTVIGSPFWMAPEVISECGYSLPADIWSLGICVIEMAEMVPPRAHMHPMKVLLKIPSLPAPHFSEQDKFSADSCDFVSCTLRKNPQERLTAVQLTHHRWLAEGSGGALAKVAVAEHVQRACDLIARYGGRDEAMKARDEDELLLDGGAPAMIQSHDEIIADALRTLKQSALQSADGLSLMDSLAWQGEKPQLRAGVTVEIPAAPVAGGTSAPVEEARSERIGASRRAAVSQATIKLTRADGNKVIATAVASKKKRKAKKAPSSPVATGASEALGGSGPSSPASTTKAASPPLSTNKPASGGKRKPDLPPEAAALMKRLTAVLRTLKALISRATARTITKDEAMRELQSASLALADLIGHPALTHPYCARASAQLARFRQKATTLCLAIDDRMVTASSAPSTAVSGSDAPPSSPSTRKKPLRRRTSAQVSSPGSPSPSPAASPAQSPAVARRRASSSTHGKMAADMLAAAESPAPPAANAVASSGTPSSRRKAPAAPSSAPSNELRRTATAALSSSTGSASSGTSTSSTTAHRRSSSSTGLRRNSKASISMLMQAEPPAELPTGAKLFACALFDFVPEEQGEIALSMGDWVAVYDFDPDGWARGVVHGSGALGDFPSSRTDVVRRARAAGVRPSRASATAEPVEEIRTQNTALMRDVRGSEGRPRRKQ